MVMSLCFRAFHTAVILRAQTRFDNHQLGGNLKTQLNLKLDEFNLNFKLEVDSSPRPPCNALVPYVVDRSAASTFPWLR